MAWKNAKGGLVWLLNRILNKNHSWIDYYDPATGGMSDSSYAPGDNSIIDVAPSDAGGLFENLARKYGGTGLTDAEKEANAFSSAEAEKSRNWEEYMARNKYQMETQSMESAGINPAMVYGGGSLVPTASNGASASSVSPEMGNLFDVISTFARLPNELKQMKANIELTEAESAKAKAEKSNIEQNTENAKQAFDFNTEINPLRVEAQKLANNLTRAEEKEVYAKVDDIVATIRLKGAQEQTEYSKQSALEAEEILNNARAWQIVEMLPYQKALASAQTSEAKAQAQYYTVQGAIQNKLLNEGQIDAMIAEAKAKASSAEARATLDNIRQGLRDGSWYPGGDYSGGFFSDAWNALMEAGGKTLQGLILAVDNLNPLSGMLRD